MTITVADLISKLQSFSNAHPENGMRTVYLRDMDGETCCEFATAICADHVDGNKTLIFAPYEMGHKFKMLEAKIN